MKRDEHDMAVDIGAALAVTVCGGTLYVCAVMLLEALADKLCVWLNAVIAIL